MSTKNIFAGTLFCVTGLLLSLQSMGQKQLFSYEALDSFTARINSAQKNVEGNVALSSIAEGRSATYHISSPEKPFQFYFHNQLASHVFYTNDTAIVTENIDFSRVRYVTSDTLNKGRLRIVKLVFDHPLEKKLFRNAKLIETIYSPVIEFFSMAEVDGEELYTQRFLYTALAYIVTRFKIANGLITTERAARERSMADVARQGLRRDKEKMIPGYLKEFSDGIYYQDVLVADYNEKQAIQKIRTDDFNSRKEAFEKEYRQNHPRVQAFVDSLCKEYFFSPNLTLEQFRKYNKEVRKFINDEPDTPGGNVYSTRKPDNYPGPRSIEIDPATHTVKTYTYGIAIDPSDPKKLHLPNLDKEMRARIFSAVSYRLIKSTAEDGFVTSTIIDPLLNVFVTLSYKKIAGWQGVLYIIFTVDKTGKEFQ